jgi:hypothetical protein
MLIKEMKEKKANQLKICNKCKKKIYPMTDEYCTLTQFTDGLQTGIGHYHITCFRNHFMNISELKGKADSMIENANQIMKRLADK